MRWLTSFRLRSRDAGTRAQAARKLGIPGSTANVSALEPLLHDPERAVRQAAVEALGVIGGDSAVPLLLDAARAADEVRPEADAAALRASIAAALGAVGQPALPALLEAAAGRDPRLRECALTALATIGGDRAVAALARALGDDRSALRQLAARALARTAGAAAVPELARALSHRDAATRRTAAEALGQAGAEDAVPVLRRALADRDRGVQSAAVQGLAVVGGDSAIGALVEALCHADREVRQAAAQALRGAAWTPDEEQRALHAALHGRFELVGGRAGAGPAADALVELLKTALADRSAASRAGAASALGRLGDARAAGSLAAMLGDPDPAAREAASSSLAGLGPSSIDAVLPAFDDRSATTRGAARNVLQAIGPGRLTGYLIDRLSPGTAVTHGGLPLRVVERLEALDEARHAADSLERLLRAAGGEIPPAALQRVTELADLVLIEPGQVPNAGERLDLEGLRAEAARTLSGGGSGQGRGQGAAR